jgi:group I intron endonuclease
VCGIYKITNKVNGKVYVGQALDIKHRFNRHRNDAFDPQNRQYNSALYQAIRKYGFENFVFEILEECTPNQLDEREIYYIAKLQAFGTNGYNLTPGGRSAARVVVDDKTVLAIIDRLKTTTDTYDTIAKEYNLKTSTVHHINNGKCCYCETEKYPIRKPLGELARYQNHCAICGTVIENRHTHCVKCSNKINNAKLRRAERPETLELAKMIIEYGFVKVGERFSVSDNAIKKWLKNDGVPYKKQELIDWYNKQMGIVPSPPKPKNGNKERSKPVKQIDPQTNEVLQIFPSILAAGKALGKPNGNSIGFVCRGLNHTAYGYKWEYA